MGDGRGVVVVSARHVGGTRGSGILSSAADVLGMSVVRGKSTPAYHKAPNCRHFCAVSTFLICWDQQNQPSGSDMRLI